MSDDDYIKGACVHCHGRIKFPSGAMGSTIACPHCSKPTPLTDPSAPPSDTIKGACSSCHGRISFPTAAAGSTIACPHCGSQTVLAAAGAPAPTPAPAHAPQPAHNAPTAHRPSPPVPGAPPQQRLYKARIPSKRGKSKGTMFALIGVGAVVLVGIAVLVTVALVKKGGGGGGGGSVGKGSGLELLSSNIQRAQEGGLVYVVGVVTNHDPVQYFNVKVEFDLFDSNGQPLGETSDYNGNLAPNKGWEFRALVLEENAADAKPKAGGGVSGEKDAGQ